MVNIGLDLDGVIRDFSSSLVSVYKRENTKHMVTPIKDWNSYSLQSYFPIGNNIGRFMHENIFDIFMHAKPYKDAYNGVYKLSQHHKLILVSYQISKHAEYISEMWLEQNGFKFDKIIFTKDKEKVDNIDMLVDDCTDNLKKILSADHRVIPVAFDRPWNKDWCGDRVSHWDEIEKVIKRRL